MAPQPPITTKVLISAHGDTNWKEHKLERRMSQRPFIELESKLLKQQYRYVDKKNKKAGVDEQQPPQTRIPTKETEEEVEFFGHMDNFGGVYSTMKAYFSGQLPPHGVQIEITYGEETDMEGANQVSKDVQRSDVVIVVDVTGTPTNSNLIIEKCWQPRLRSFICQTLRKHSISFDLYVGCSDPIANQDETNVYSRKTDFTFFLGLPVRGGDYNEGPVYCYKKDIQAVSKALIVLSQELLLNFRTEAVVDELGDEKEDVKNEGDEEEEEGLFGSTFSE